MSLEAQIERLNINLEKIIAKGIDLQVNTAGILNPIPAKVVKETPAAEPKPETKKAEPKVEPRAEPEAVPAETNTASKISNASLEDLAEKVKALAAKAGRDAVIEVFTAFKVKKLSELDTAQFIAMDIALAKAITKANAG